MSGHKRLRTIPAENGVAAVTTGSPITFQYLEYVSRPLIFNQSREPFQNPFFTHSTIFNGLQTPYRSEHSPSSLCGHLDSRCPSDSDEELGVLLRGQCDSVCSLSDADTSDNDRSACAVDVQCVDSFLEFLCNPVPNSQEPEEGNYSWDRAYEGSPELTGDHCIQGSQ